MKNRILLIEDEINLLNSLSFILEQRGFDVRKAMTGEQGIVVARNEKPDLALIDIGLPGIDGFETASRLNGMRQNNGLIIVFLTGSDEEDDIVRAFKGLADDYIVKPVRPRVLVARIEALLEKKRSETNTELVVCGPISINLSSLEANLEGKKISLTPTEFKILRLLADNPQKTFSRSAIINAVYGENCHLTEKSIDFQIHGLRQKLGSHADMLVTLRGFGFKLVVS